MDNLSLALGLGVVGGVLYIVSRPKAEALPVALGAGGLGDSPFGGPVDYIGPSDAPTPQSVTINFPEPSATSQIYGQEQSDQWMSEANTKKSRSSGSSYTPQKNEVSFSNPSGNAPIGTVQGTIRTLTQSPAQKTLSSIPSSQKTQDLKPISGVHPTKKESKKEKPAYS